MLKYKGYHYTAMRREDTLRLSDSDIKRLEDFRQKYQGAHTRLLMIISDILDFTHGDVDITNGLGDIRPEFSDLGEAAYTAYKSLDELRNKLELYPR